MWPFSKPMVNKDFIVPTKRGPLKVNAYTEEEARNFAANWSKWEDEEEAKRDRRGKSPFALWLNEGRPEGGVP